MPQKRELRDRLIVLEQQTIAAREALAIQAREYERRLSDLNHAHAAAVEAQAMTVPREMFDQYRDTQRSNDRTLAAELSTWKVSVEKAISAAQASSRAWIIAVGLFMTLMEVVFRYVAR